MRFFGRNFGKSNEQRALERAFADRGEPVMIIGPTAGALRITNRFTVINFPCILCGAPSSAVIEKPVLVNNLPSPSALRALYAVERVCRFAETQHHTGLHAFERCGRYGCTDEEYFRYHGEHLDPGEEVRS